MPTSDSGKLREMIKRIAVALGVVAALLCLDVIATLVLQPYGGNTECVWYEYGQCRDEHIETLVVGSSISQNGINPEPFDRLGGGAVNLSTPCQSLGSSYVAIERALKDHPEMKRVLLGTSYSELESSERIQYASAFAQAMAAATSPVEALPAYVHIATNKAVGRSDASIAVLAPFLLNHVDYTPSAIRDNVRNRLECTTPLEARSRTESWALDLGHGFVNYNGVVDLSNASIYDVVDVFKSRDYFDAEELSDLRRICALCKQYGVELVVFCPPQPQFQMQSVGKLYPQNMSQVRDIVEEGGGTYIDFNLLNPDVYAPTMTEFGDAIHLNTDGAKRFTEYFVDTLQQLESGKDIFVDYCSYEQWGKVLSTIHGITFAFIRPTFADGNAELEAVVYAGPSCKVEVLFEAVDCSTGEWVTIQDWSTNHSCTVPADEYDLTQTRLSARQVGATEAEFMHFQDCTK